MPETRTRQIILTLAAIICFAIGFLLAVDLFDGDQAPWLFAGLATFAAAHLP